MAPMLVCAVVVTHLRPSQFTGSIPVPYVVTTDVPRHGAHFINVSGSHGESAIGAHLHGAIDHAFSAFPNCTVLSVFEDDVEPSSDYFRMLKAVIDYPGFTSTAKAFCPLNDYGHTATGDAGNIKLTTHSIGLGMAFSRQNWAEWRRSWATRGWDNFLRATKDIVCLTPEVSRVKHHSRRSSIHGTDRSTDTLPFARSYRGGYTILPPPRRDPKDRQAPVCSRKAVEGLRGTYYGLLSGTSGTCRVAATRPTEELDADWRIASRNASCDDACTAVGKSCSPRLLQLDASRFLSHWPFGFCDEYGAEMGRELPSSVVVNDGGRRRCNVPCITEQRSCGASHGATERLCPCYVATKHNSLYY
jgi:hypothetical protein